MRLTVYYDASCPMCASEMHALREKAGPERLQLIDCSGRAFDDATCRGDGVTQADLMLRLHVRDAQGRWLVAMDAYEAMYRTAGHSAAARLWGNRLLRPLLDLAYGVIARHRQRLSRLGADRIVRWLGRR